MNKKKLTIELLSENVDALYASLQWLKQSVERCSSIVKKTEFTDASDFEALGLLPHGLPEQ